MACKKKCIQTAENLQTHMSAIISRLELGEGFRGPLLCLLHRESVILSNRLVLVCIICLRSSSIHSNGGYFIIIYENTTLNMPTLPNVDPHVSRLRFICLNICKKIIIWIMPSYIYFKNFMSFYKSIT